MSARLLKCPLDKIDLKTLYFVIKSHTKCDVDLGRSAGAIPVSFLARARDPELPALNKIP